MKKIFLIIVSVLLLVTSCHQKEDLCIAEIYNVKLYRSEIEFPKGLSPNDSLAWLNLYIEDWAKHQILCHKAEEILTLQEKNFDKQIEEYKDKLLIEAYFQKISEDYQLDINEMELRQFMKKYGHDNTVEKSVVRVNYIKLPKNGKINKRVKELFFDDEKRLIERNVIETLCADSVEYFMDSDAWLYLDYIESEFPFEIDNEEELLNTHRYIDVCDDDYNYLVVFLQYRKHRPASEREEELQIAKTLLMQQKKLDYINSVVDSLYQEALDNNKIIL